MSLKRFPAQMLLDFQETVNRIHNADKGLYMLLFRTIRQWYSDNGVRLESLKDKIKALHEEFLEHEEPEVKGEPKKIKIILEQKIPAEAKYETRIIPNKWYQFGKPKTEQVKIADATFKIIPEDVVFLPGKTKEEFDKRYAALVMTEVEINF